MIMAWTRLSDGTLIPSIPEPFWYGGGLLQGFRYKPACYKCKDPKGKKMLLFKDRDEWEEHYIKYHSVEDEN
jgi:hypothetical protein